jgi:hypothetical protein
LKRAAKEDKGKGKEPLPAQQTMDRHPKLEAEAEKTDEPESTTGKTGGNEPTNPVVDAGKAEAENSTKASEEPAAAENPNGNTRNPASFIAPAGARTSMEMQTQQRLDDIIAEGEKSPEAPKSPKGIKSWLKTKFAGRHSKSQKEELKDALDETAISDSDGAKLGEPKPAITEAHRSPTQDASVTTEPYKDDVSPITTEQERTGRSKRRASSVSSLSAPEVGREEGEGNPKDEDFEEARDHFDEELAPAPTFAATKSASPMRDSKFHEEM